MLLREERCSYTAEKLYVNLRKHFWWNMVTGEGDADVEVVSAD